MLKKTVFAIFAFILLALTLLVYPWEGWNWDSNYKLDSKWSEDLINLSNPNTNYQVDEIIIIVTTKSQMYLSLSEVIKNQTLTVSDKPTIKKILDGISLFNGKLVIQSPVLAKSKSIHLIPLDNENMRNGYIILKPILDSDWYSNWYHVWNIFDAGIYFIKLPSVLQSIINRQNAVQH